MKELTNIVFIGEPEVGKSALVYGLAKEGILKYYTQTIGVDFKNKLLSLNDNRSISCRLWDTSGDEKYRDIRNSYYKSAKIICIVINANQLDAHQIQKIQYYLADIEKHNPKAKILIIANNKRKSLPAIELTEQDLLNNRIKPSQYIIVSAYEIALQVLTGQETALEKKLAELLEKTIGPPQINLPASDSNSGQPIRKSPSFAMDSLTLGKKDITKSQTQANTAQPSSSFRFFSKLFSTTEPNVSDAEIRTTLAVIKQLSKAQAAEALDLIHLHLKDGPLRNPNKPYHISMFGLGGTTYGGFKNKNLTSVPIPEREIHFKSHASYTENGMIWLSMTMPFSSGCLALNMLTTEEINGLDGRLVLLTLYNDVALFSNGLWDIPVFRHPTTLQFYKDLPKQIKKAIITASQTDNDILTKTRPAAAGHL